MSKKAPMQEPSLKCAHKRNKLVCIKWLTVDIKKNEIVFSYIPEPPHNKYTTIQEVNFSMFLSLLPRWGRGRVCAKYGEGLWFIPSVTISDVVKRESDSSVSLNWQKM